MRVLNSVEQAGRPAAWGRNALIARQAYDALCSQYPKEHFSLRHLSFVAAETFDPERT
jgi:hypothetical protein